MRGHLKIVAGPDQGRLFTLDNGQTLVIGRGQQTETRLSDPAVSRVHCQLQVDGGKFLLTDNGSSSGTFVNSKQLAAKTTQELKPGDVIRIGGTQLQFQLEGQHEESTLVQPATTAKPKLTTPTSEPLQELVGKTVAHFSVESVLAKGSTGLIFKATDTEKNRDVALKVLWPEYAKDDEEMQRFVRAMKTMLPIRHPNLVQLYGAGKTSPHYVWISMELVDGESLAQVIERIGVAGMLDWRYGLRVAVHIARALEEAAKHSIIHRNITPTNIMIRSSDKMTKLGDLMLAKALEGTLAQQITRPGQIVGEVAYMSPERTRGTDAVDERADIYSLGATVYALLTGRPPIQGGSLAETISKIRQEEPAKPKKFQLAIPDRFEGAVLQMLAKRPEDRFPTPTDLLKELERVAKFEGVTI